jgi:hypothetical protein
MPVGGRLRVIRALVPTVVPWEKSRDLGQVDAGFLHAVDDRQRRILRGGGHFLHPDVAGLLIEDENIRESTARVHCRSEFCHAATSFRGSGEVN